MGGEKRCKQSKRCSELHVCIDMDAVCVRRALNGNIICVYIGLQSQYQSTRTAHKHIVQPCNSDWFEFQSFQTQIALVGFVFIQRYVPLKRPHV